MSKSAIVIALAAAGAIGWLFWRQTQTAPLIVTGFVEADEVRVGSQVGGRVEAVLINEGDRVQTSTPLFTLAPFDWRERLKEAEAQLAAYRAEYSRLQVGFRVEEIAQAQAKRDRGAAVLEKLTAGPRPREIEIAREKLKIARANLELAQSEHKRVTRLREEERAARTEYDVAIRELKSADAGVASAEQEVALLEEGTRKEDVAEARAALAETDQALNLLKEGYRPEDIAKAAAQVEAAEARVAAIKTQMSELTVVSPCDCVVEGIDLRPGDLVPASAPAVTLLELSRLWIRSYVPESLLGKIHLGERIPVRIDGFPDRRFMGRVTFIATDGEFTPRNIQTPEERSKQVFRIKLTLEEGHDVLRVGMAADVLLYEVMKP
jgi:multidrug resistance efflux pump